MITSIHNTPKVSAPYPTRNTTAFRGKDFSAGSVVSCTTQKNASIVSPDIFAQILAFICGCAITSLSLEGIKKGRIRYRTFMNLNKLVKTQLPEHIEFKEAKTLQEAIDYTRNVLTIRNIDKSFTLEALNMANKGITDVSNANKGCLVMPPRLIFKEFEEKTLAAIKSDCHDKQFGSIVINKKYFDPKFLKSEINKGFYYENGNKTIKFNKEFNFKIDNQGIKFDDKIIPLIEKYYENPESLTIQELKIIYTNLNKAFSIVDKPKYAPIEMIKDIEKSRGSILKKLGLHIDYSLIESMSKSEQTDYANKLLDILNSNGIPYISEIELYRPEEIIYHEMSHLQDFFKHFKNLRKCYAQFAERWYRMEQVMSNENDNIDLIKKLYPDLYEFSNNREIQETAGIISKYAQS